ncbi:MAG: hypothetical protein V1720_12945 [bacterium]
MKTINKISFLLIISALSISNAFTETNKDDIDKKSLSFMREKFYAAVENEDELEKLDKYIIRNFPDGANKYPPIIIAYKGGVEALKGKHAFWPFDKYSYLVSALDILEYAVSLSPEDLEIRFMRFSIVSHLPGILGYNEEMYSDRDMLVKLLLKKDYSQLDENIQKGIVQFMIDSDELTDVQLSMFSKNFNLAILDE